LEGSFSKKGEKQKQTAEQNNEQARLCVIHSLVNDAETVPDLWGSKGQEEIFHLGMGEAGREGHLPGLQ
jgi:hypothetical protein